MTDRLVIVADDLTGAADSAAAYGSFADVAVVLDPSAPLPPAEIVAVDTDTRHADPARAAAATGQAVRAAVAAHARVYKKIDSTVRGNIAAELRAMTAELGRPVLLAPAFPGTGRTVSHGVLHVDGEPHAALAGLFDDSGLRAAVVPLGVVRDGRAAVVAECGRLIAAGADVLCADAVTDADLVTLHDALDALRPGVLAAGSAGLTRVAARAARTVARPLPTGRAGQVLTVLGSYSGLAARQRAALTASGEVTIVVLRAPFGPAEQGEAAATLAAATGDVLLVPDPGAPVRPQDAADVAAALGAVAGPFARERAAGLAGLVLTGGETARAVLLAAGVPSFTVLGELEPGVARSVLPPLGGLPLVTKAGAFGAPATLENARRALRSTPRKGASMARPIVAITMGDAAGVGPEVVVKALATDDIHRTCRPLVVGDAARLRTAIGITGVPLEVNPVEGPEDGRYRTGVVDCLDLGVIPDDLPFGRLSPVAGDGAYRFVEAATELAVAKRVHAICTAPLNKEALHAGGHRFPGHTELLAELTGTPEVSMMLAAPQLRVVHVTTHIGLVDAVERIEPGLVARTIRRGEETLRRSGVDRPRIAVCGINPHAGENGLFGRGEEEEKVTPAVERCRAEGIDVHGPLPADTVFFRAVRGDFDLVVAMYHDQGHGPVKVLGLDAGVNMTIGLPVIRTSVDHGTAFDIAGTGKADHASMLEALRQAVELAPEVGLEAGPEVGPEVEDEAS